MVIAIVTHKVVMSDRVNRNASNPTATAHPPQIGPKQIRLDCLLFFIIIFGPFYPIEECRFQIQQRDDPKQSSPTLTYPELYSDSNIDNR